MTLEDVRSEWMDFLPACTYRSLVGYSQEILPIPREDGPSDLVPVIGEAW